MKATGYINQMRQGGKFVIPIELRKLHKLTADTIINIDYDIIDDYGVIVISKYKEFKKCNYCGEIESLVAFKKGHLCEWCKNSIWQYHQLNK